MVFGMRGGKPSNPLDSNALGTFNFTDYGLVYASAAELEAMQVRLNVNIVLIQIKDSQFSRYTMRITSKNFGREQPANSQITFN